jgi:hypothetical protein
MQKKREIVVIWCQSIIIRSSIKINKKLKKKDRKELITGQGEKKGKMRMMEDKMGIRNEG